MKMARTEVYAKFEREAIKRPSAAKDQVNEDFYRITESAYAEAMNGFRRAAADLVVEGSGWGEHALAHELELST